MGEEGGVPGGAPEHSMDLDGTKKIFVLKCM